MLKNTLVFTYILMVSFIYSIDLELEAYIGDNEGFISEAIIFKNDLELLYLDDLSIYNINIITLKTTLITKINPVDVPYKRYHSRIFKIKNKDEFIIVFNSNGKDSEIFIHLKGSNLSVSNENLNSLDFIDKLIIGDIYDNYKMALLGDYYYSFEGSNALNLPYITKSSIKKTYFTMDDDDYKILKTDKVGYLNSIDNYYRNNKMPTISINKFLIAFLGWTIEDIDYANKVGDFSGLFIFRVIYDGVITEPSLVYDLTDSNLLVKVNQISENSVVKVRDNKYIEGHKYYLIDYDDTRGYILASKIKI